MNERMLNDSAWRMSQRIMEVFEPVLGNIDRRDVFLAIFARIKGGLNVYEAQVDRVHQWLRPMHN